MLAIFHCCISDPKPASFLVAFHILLPRTNNVGGSSGFHASESTGVMPGTCLLDT
jgi:hypothetical protein